jgi:hypothetical protein
MNVARGTCGSLGFHQSKRLHRESNKFRYIKWLGNIALPFWQNLCYICDVLELVKGLPRRLPFDRTKRQVALWRAS